MIMLSISDLLTIISTILVIITFMDEHYKRK